MLSTQNLVDKWYQQLLSKGSCSFLEKIFPGTIISGISLEKLYIEQNIIAEGKRGIGRYLANASYANATNSNSFTVLSDSLTHSESNCILILGDTGSGKTFFLNNLAREIAAYKTSGKRDINLLAKKYYNKFVIIISIKDVINDVTYDVENPEDYINQLLLKSIRIEFSKAEYQHIINNSDSLFENGILFLLDGLDEVEPTLAEQLICSINKISRDTKNTIILTSRNFCYENNMAIFGKFTVYYLAPFNKTQITDYINEWYECIYPNIDVTYRENMINRMIHVLFEEEFMMELASCPLLLTLLMLLYSTEQQIPVSKTKLYEEVLLLLLGRWNKGRVDSQIVRASLEESAYLAMLNNTNARGQDDSLTLFPFLCEAFTKKLPPSKNALPVIRAAAHHTGIIIETAKDTFSFSHRSFQEYLASCYIINELDNAEYFLMITDNNFSYWKEVSVFVIGNITMSKPYEAIGLLYFLVPDEYKSKHVVPIGKLITAASALVEARKINVKTDFSIITERIRNWFTHIISQVSCEYSNRFIIGNLLDKLGDTRPGVGIKTQKNKMLPDIKWREIPEGWSEFGSEQGIINRPRMAKLGTYYISQYPVTNGQYGLFVDSGGYEKEEFWTIEGWKWVNGAKLGYFDERTCDRYAIERERQYTEWLNARTVKKRKAPYWWDEQPWNQSNRPVIGITWYEAMAFCHWLNNLSSAEPDGLGYKFRIDLPTLEEWEKAARGPHCFLFPWGNNLQRQRIRANSEEGCLKQTCAVGLFPESRSGYGVDDTAGNVYEWVSTGVICTNDRIERLGTEDVERSCERVVKGGAWNFPCERHKCAFDEWDYPIIFDQNTGFRIVLRPIGAKSEL